MIELIKVLKKSHLFANISDNEIETILPCLQAHRKVYEKNSYIFMEDTQITTLGIVLSGRVQIVKDDFWGNRTIIADMIDSELIGESFASGNTKNPMVSVIAFEKTEVLMMNFNNIVTTCAKACSSHTQLIKNLLAIIANKNIMLTEKITHITRRTTRDKLLSYFSSQAKLAHSNTFSIPYNRQQLADFLSVDRSAMSYELCKMRDDNLLEFNKNHFSLNKEIIL
jgi:CRP-like cAMP-binding protein